MPDRSANENRNKQESAISSSDAWPIDHSALRELVGLETAEQILVYLPDFFAACTPQLERIQRAAATRDDKELYLAAHTLRGSSANLAMQTLVELCRQIEKLSKNGQTDAAIARVAELRAEFERIRAVLQSES